MLHRTALRRALLPVLCRTGSLLLCGHTAAGLSCPLLLRTVRLCGTLLPLRFRKMRALYLTAGPLLLCRTPLLRAGLRAFSALLFHSLSPPYCSGATSHASGTALEPFSEELSVICSPL